MGCAYSRSCRKFSVFMSRPRPPRGQPRPRPRQGNVAMLGRPVGQLQFCAAYLGWVKGYLGWVKGNSYPEDRHRQA
jgi:hypothetical protein